MAQTRALNRVTCYEAAVDLVAQAQRGLKEKLAWCEMARSWLVQDIDLSLMRQERIQPAQESYIGVWVNNAEERDCLWFLTRAGVPCFVVH
ncbi:hypothetical protein C8J57DRAFT_1368921, partial [Mycena rebaudengoi]